MEFRNSLSRSTIRTKLKFYIFLWLSQVHFQLYVSFLIDPAGSKEATCFMAFIAVVLHTVFSVFRLLTCS